MAGGGGGERTEQATPKRRRDERRKGNVFMSQELGILVGLLAVVYTIQALSGYIMDAMAGGFYRFWDQAATATDLTSADMPITFLHSVMYYGIAALPALLMAGLAAVIVTVAQTRGLVSFKKVAPKGSNLSPLKGIKKIFSMRGLVELLKSLLKITILAYVVYSRFVERFETLPRLLEMEFTQILFYGAEFLMDIVTNVALIFAFLAAADYMYQRWQYEKDLRMSKQEIKEEYKQTEGDPQIKGQIRQKQRQMSQSRMMQQVPDADVVIRNPTHYAVALRYDAKDNRAPMVLAKGADLLALRIVKVAEENGVAVMENKPLARGIYENVPLEREIPEEFFQPVAEVLAYVYSTSKKSKIPKPAKRDGR